MTGIYIIKNKINNKIYVGQTANYTRRKTLHKQRYKKKEYREYSRIYKAMHKYGIENFEFEFIEECSEELLNEKEIYWINYYDSFNNGYNATHGGNNRIAYWQGKKRNVETNKKIADKLKGKSWGNHNEDYKSLLSNRLKGNQRGNKKIVCVELNEVFDSIKIASDTLKIDSGSITNAAKGNRNTAGGYHWKYFSSLETISKESTVEDKLPLEAQNNSIK